MRSLVIALLLAASLRAQPGGLAGVVVDHIGKPLTRVHLRLISSDLISQSGVASVYGVDTDAAGRFSVDGLKPGLYTVMASRSGYLQTADSPSGTTTLAIKPGQQITDYKVILVAHAVIAGRILDEHGDPVPAVSVQVEPVPTDKPAVSPLAKWSQTDDNGEFRLITAPGKYYVKIQGQELYWRLAEIRTDGTSGELFVPTYYPSAPNASGASVVQAAAGEVLTGIDIHLLRAGSAAARTFRVSGIVTGMPDNGRASVILRFAESAEQLKKKLDPTNWRYGLDFNVTSAGTDGKFSMSGLRAGYYGARAFSSSGKTGLASQPVYFRLDSADETNLQLMLTAGVDVEVRGKLEIVGDAPAGSHEKRTVRLESADEADADSFFGQGEQPAVEVAPDGTFIAHVWPGKFRPVVEPLPENGYVKEVALDGKAAADEVLDLSQGVSGSRVKITVSRAGGRISGRILHQDGKPALVPMIVFFAADIRHVDARSAVRVSDGRYSFKAIRPGKYRLFAVDVLEMPAIGGTGNNDKTMQQLFDAGAEIEIKEGDSISRDIPAWTKMPDRKEANAPHR